MHFIVSHKLNIIDKKHPVDDNLSVKLPTCKCGWQGKEVIAAHDYQIDEVNDQYIQHMNSPDRDSFLE
jgi:hypothetical protein